MNKGNFSQVTLFLREQSRPPFNKGVNGDLDKTLEATLKKVDHFLFLEKSFIKTQYRYLDDKITKIKKGEKTMQCREPPNS